MYRAKNDANDAMFKEPIRCFRYSFQAKADEQTIKSYVNPCQNDLPVVTANLYPWDKQSMQISNDYYRNSSSNQAVADEVANTISL